MFVNKILAGSVITLALSTLIAAGDVGPGPGKGEPFKALGTPTSLVVQGGPPPAPLFFEVSAEGNATYLGRYTSEASFTVMFTSPNQAVFSGGGVLTGAHGDQIHFTMEGDFFPGPVPGGIGTFTIVGGTGRFVGARGGGAFLSLGGHTAFDGCIQTRRRR